LNNLTHYGTNGDDVLFGISTGAVGDDVIYGLDGNDTIYAGLGNDTVDGGVGNDTIILTGGNDTIIASAGFDTIDAAEGIETLLIPQTYGANDVTLLQVAADGDQNYNDLQVLIDGLGQVLAKHHFTGTTQALDQIVF